MPGNRVFRIDTGTASPLPGRTVSGHGLPRRRTMKVVKTLLTLVLRRRRARRCGVRRRSAGDRPPRAPGRVVHSAARVAGVVADPPSSSPSSPSSTPTHHAPVAADVLKPGTQGPQVRELQQRLFQLAWLPETTTGVYDAATASAVKGFQGKHGLRRTGVLDDADLGPPQGDDQHADPRRDVQRAAPGHGPAPGRRRRRATCARSRRGCGRSTGTSATSPARTTRTPSPQSRASRPSASSRSPATSTSARSTGSPA